jgi:hypothetical protein
MSEATMRSRLVLRCKDLDMKPIENKVAKGTPDVNYIDGWLELKWLRGWPPKGGPVAISHYTNHQRLWLKRRWARGGRAFLVLQVKTDWFVFCGCDALPVGTLDRDQLEEIAIECYTNFKIDNFKELITLDMGQLEQIRVVKGICNSPLLKNFSLNAVGAAKRSTKRRTDSEYPTIGTSTGNEDTSAKGFPTYEWQDD